MSTLLRLKAEIKGTQQPFADSADGLELFREIWKTAMAEGRQQQEALITQLRDELTALALENERLDGLALEYGREKEAAEAERDRVATEFRLLQADLVKGAAQTKEALQKLADERANHAAASTALRQELAAEVRRLHEMELELVRLKTLDAKESSPRGRIPKPNALNGEAMPKADSSSRGS